VIESGAESPHSKFGVWRYNERVNLRLPHTEKRKQFELRALALRDFAGVREDEPLDPFALARFARLMVVDFEKVEGLSPEARAHLLGAAVNEWSGGACSRPLPNGWRVVILNPAHGSQRNRATLMEEISHVFLGHKPNRLATIVEAEKPSDISSESPRKMLAREYNHADEEAAYAIGAAALLPYGALQNLVHAGRSSQQIARRFQVSRQLTEYRIKVTRLWVDYKRLSERRTEHV
jgi:IrrE N-terminal-like domain